MVFKHDVVFIGSGLAGLRAAIEASQKADATIISKVSPTPAPTPGPPRGESPLHWEMTNQIGGNGIVSDNFCCL